MDIADFEKIVFCNFYIVVTPNFEVTELSIYAPKQNFRKTVIVLRQ